MTPSEQSNSPGPAVLARRYDERTFGLDLEQLAPSLRAFGDRARRLGVYGLEQALRDAAESCESWGRSLREGE